MLAVEGAAEPGFELVADVLRHARLRRGGAAFAAYVDGREVVNIYAGEARPKTPWGPDTLTTLMSATKGVTALAAQILVDRGELDLDARVAQYWPEYATAGKERTLVRHFLNHSAGVTTVPGYQDLLLLDGTGWDDEPEILRRLAAARPIFEPGTRHVYHAVTYGWLVGELVRRVTGISLGSFIDKEIRTPLGLDLWLGLPEVHEGRVAALHIPEMMPRIVTRVQDSFDSLTGAALMGRGGRTVISEKFFNNPKTHALELGAANGFATAAALARMYAALAGGGRLDGTQLVSEASLALFRRETGRSHGPVRLRFATGYLRPSRQLFFVPPMAMFGPNDEAFGHPGAGGQIAFADPVSGVAVAFVRNWIGMSHALQLRLVRALYACL